MHGIVFSELKRYVDGKFGGSTWATLLTKAGLGSKLFLPTQTYPDQEIIAIAVAASQATGLEIPAILEDFGEFITPSLLKLYGLFVKPEWKTLDLIENTEETIHKVVRMKNPGASPPQLKCQRTKPNEVILTYSSARRMCGLAKGIVKGLGKHYGEKVEVAESQCMLKNDPHCLISIRRS